MRSVVALIVAGGSGQRFASQLPKQFLPLCGKSVLQWSLELFQNLEEIERIYLTLPSEYLDTYTKYIQAESLPKLFAGGVIAGGVRRQDSVCNGLDAISNDDCLVAIHDAVRPLADPEKIRLAIREAEHSGGAILASPVIDTLKQCDSQKRIVETLDRSQIWNAQTPQIFDLARLRKAYRKREAENQEMTDDAQAYERMGWPVTIIESPPSNLKITTPQDLGWAEWLLSHRR